MAVNHFKIKSAYILQTRIPAPECGMAPYCQITEKGHFL
jgi:hypothetical protein